MTVTVTVTVFRQSPYLASVAGPVTKHLDTTLMCIMEKLLRKETTLTKSVFIKLSI